MTRVAFLVPSLEAGGAERVTLRLVAGLLEHGYEVDIVAIRAFGQLMPLVPAGARLIDLRKGRMFTAIFALARYLREYRPDITVGVLDSMSAIGLIAQVFARSRTRFVVQSHSSPRPNPFLKRYVVIALMRLFFRRAASIVSAGAADLAGETAAYSGLPPSRVDVIWNGVIEPEFFERVAEAPRLWSDSPEGVKTLIAVGRLHDVKNYKVLVDAMAILRDRKVSFRLLIAGEGYERPLIERQIASLRLDDRVTLLGFVENPLPLILRADLFVLASRAEGMPVALIESLGCGTPIVSTDCEFGPSTILGQGRWGRLVPVGDAPALADGIEGALLERPDVPALKKRAEAFTTSAMVDGYVALFQRLMQR